MIRCSILGDLTRLVSCFAVVLFVSACALPPLAHAPDNNSISVETPELAAPPPPVSARTVEQFDTTTEDQRVAAATGASNGALLGTTVASLGDPSKAGFWIETPLVNKRATGRLIYPVTGKSAEVELIPIEGGGSRVSLAALRLLEAPLTDLPVLEVYEIQ
ncbi:MAG: hypothetical protein ACR2O1_09425 [Boseongicola sp.]